MVRSRLLFVSVILIAALCTTTAAAEILIGMAGPMTGKDAWFGKQLQRGAELAVADLNAAGGVDVAAASSAPRCNCSPNQAFLPVIGPVIPIRTSARAGPPSAAANMTMATATRRRMTVLPHTQIDIPHMPFAEGRSLPSPTGKRKVLGIRSWRREGHEASTVDRSLDGPRPVSFRLETHCRRQPLPWAEATGGDRALRRPSGE